MPAHMADLPDYPGSITLTNDQRYNAALSLADVSQSKHALAYYLCALGLAEHRSDGTFASLPERGEEVSWFSAWDHGGQATFCLPVGQLDDCR
jgi:hypothetical protein